MTANAPGRETTKLENLRKRFAALGQDHVFAFWDSLDSSGRERLARQAARIAEGLTELVRAERQAVAALDQPPPRRIEPADVLALPEYGGDPEPRQRALGLGLERIRAGRVAALVVAGGQGTRLGFDGPKGSFPLGPVSDRCLFQIQAQKLAGIERRTGCRVPWYVMTSDATDGPTRQLFEEHRCFGLDPEAVFIFQQDMLPAFDFEGRLMLAAPDRIFENPGGHGGAIPALERSGALADMRARGIDTLFYYQVDNPLIRMLDPLYVGLHAGANAEMSCKVLRKPDPDVKWGVVARVDGRLGIVEYTELDDEMRHARDSEGRLVYWAGSPAIHLFSVAFLERVAGDVQKLLPLHASPKRILTIDESGHPVEPEEPNGYKLERFVFDALPLADRVCLVEVLAREEFSPVKNAEGPESPETARRDLSAEYRRWLVEGGVDLPSELGRIELDHSVVDGPEDVRALGWRSLEDAGDALLMEAGSH